MTSPVSTGVAHVALYCRDIDKSTDFYTRVLGLTHLFTQKKPDGSLFYVYLHAGNHTFIELFPTAEPPSPAVRPGVAHICLAVADINAAAAHVKSAGWQLSRGEPRLGMDGNWQVWVDDPDGVPIELMQMMPDCIQYKTLAKAE